MHASPCPSSSERATWNSAALPPPQTLEAWALEFVQETSLPSKLRPPAPPDVEAENSWEPSPPVRRISMPGRPVELRVLARTAPAPRPAALKDTPARARLLHTFVHHELQAAELFAWAFLAFPTAPREFRAGLLRLCQEELQHLQLYRGHLERLGSHYGAFPVRDWFWQRVPSVADAASFVALQGLGLEGANLEHSARYSLHFQAAGDDDGARILQQIERDEIQHVTFAVRWWEHFTGAPLDYDRWRAKLPPPLSPAVLQGRPLNRAARVQAGMSAAFLARLELEPSTSVRRSP